MLVFGDYGVGIGATLETSASTSIVHWGIERMVNRRVQGNESRDTTSTCDGSPSFVDFTKVVEGLDEDL